MAAAGEAARYAAMTVGLEAARTTAGVVASAAAAASARTSLEPTVLVLQKSAHDLFSRMIDAGSS